MNRLGRTMCLLSLGALVLPACMEEGHVGGATLDCAQPAAAWINRLRESWPPEYREAVVTESGYVAVSLPEGGAYFVALAFETLQGEEGIEVDGPVAIFGTDNPPTSGDLAYVWATQGWAEALGLIEPAGRQQQDGFAAQQAIECVPHSETLPRARRLNHVAPSHLLVYRVDSNTHRGDITYANEFGRETVRKEAHLPWEYHVAVADGYSANVSAMRYGASGYIRCTIELDGAVVRFDARTGKYSICTATETV